MATLEGRGRSRRKALFMCSILLIAGIAGFPWITGYLSMLLLNHFKGPVELTYVESIYRLLEDKGQQELYLIFLLFLILVLFCLLTWYPNTANTSTIKIAKNIEIPVAVGEGQHGSSRFMTDQEIEQTFEHCYYTGNQKLPEKNYGLVLGMKKSGKQEDITCITDDIHSIILGATRSGKTRGLILQSLWLRAYSGGSMIISDPKGELFLYTEEYLKEKGYDVITVDFRQPAKSMHYNFLTAVCQAIKEGDIPKAIDATWDIVSTLVGVPKGEPLWSNGESAVIAAAMLAVVMEAPEEYHNMANVYYFLAYMCKQNEFGEMPINQYFADLPDSHPAKTVFAVAEISPDKMRGSFFGSALATLRLFTNWNIAEMTSQSDFDPKDLGRKPTALFMIIPDEKVTMYCLVSLLVNQVYVSLVELANERGSRLDVPVDFFLDEFGNFPAIPSFGSMLSVGAGRGIRFTLVLQDYQQLEKQYEKDHENIKGNCQVTVYLKSPTYKTLEELSKRTGNYTIQVKNVSSSISDTEKLLSSGKGNYSDSANMATRALLTPDEIGRLERPYSLVLYSGKYPAILTTPDLSQYCANKEMGLGNPAHNKEILINRDAEREKRVIGKPLLWGIWKTKVEQEEEVESESKRVSFLDL